MVRQIAGGASPHHPLFTPTAKTASSSFRAWRTGDPEPDHHTIRTTVKVGRRRTGSPHPEGHTAYVTNEKAPTTLRRRPRHPSVTATIPVGQAPRKIVVQPSPAAPALTQARASAGTSTNLTATAQPEGQVIKLGALTFSDHGTKDVKGLAELDLEADDYYFAPTFLRGEPGQQLTLQIETVRDVA